MEQDKFKFKNYIISKIDCSISDDFNLSLKKENISTDIKISSEFEQENSHLVDVILEITIKSESNRLNFYIRMKGTFELSQDMPDDLVQKLASQNAPAILFPYARSIITNYTALANIPPIILPTQNFSQEIK